MQIFFAWVYTKTIWASLIVEDRFQVMKYVTRNSLFITAAQYPVDKGGKDMGNSQPNT